MRFPNSIRWFIALAILSILAASLKISLWLPLILEFTTSLGSRAPVNDEISIIGKFVGVGLNILLLLLVAMRRSRGAARAYVILTTIFFVSTAFGLVSGVTIPAQNVIGLTSFALQLASAIMLYRADSRAWLVQRPQNLGDTFA